MLRDNVFTTIHVAPLGLLGSAYLVLNVFQQSNDELGYFEAYSGGNFGISYRAKTYIPSRGFSDSFVKRSSAVPPPPSFKILGISNVRNVLNGLSSDPSTPSVHEIQSSTYRNIIAAENEAKKMKYM